MANVDLVFRQAPVSQPADLIFGEVEKLPDVEVALSATLPGLTAEVHVKPLVQVRLAAAMPGLKVLMDVRLVAEVELAATLPPPTFSAIVAPPVDVVVDAVMPPLTVDMLVSPVTKVFLAAELPGLAVAMRAKYISGTERPTVSQSATAFQSASGADAGATQGQHTGSHQPAGVTDRARHAVPEQEGVQARHGNSQRLRAGAAARHQNAVGVVNEISSSYANMLRSIRPSISAAWQVATGVGNLFTTHWQELYHDRRPMIESSWGQAESLVARVSDHAAHAVPLTKQWESEYQWAIVPPPGMYVPPVPPTQEPCYTPPPGRFVHLLFDGAPGDTNLVFICERHVTPPTETVIVPIKRVYMVINNTTLMKVVGSTKTVLPTYSMSLTIDVDSWTWGFSASLPAEALGDLLPASDGTPVELEAQINGHPYRVLAEKIGRDRSFAKDALRVTGRGKSALLADPYAPTQTFYNTIDRTAQQLMNDALTLNGASIGWSVDWNIEDWVVPAGAWNKTGRYIDALTTIAAAAGAYLQPHPTDQVMQVMSRYPLAPWDWGGMTPDFQLPASVTSTEGIEWLDKTRYNRVFISGVSDGVVGQVTRAGTAGDVLAPMVTDALITDAIAARQRGRVVLSDTGRQALVSLRLPVLDETGIITPGKSVRYVDGADIKLGLVRSTSVEVNGQPDVWQTIAVETHVEA